MGLKRVGDDGTPPKDGEEVVVRMEMGWWVDMRGGREGERVCGARAAVARHPGDRRGGGGRAAGPPRLQGLVQNVPARVWQPRLREGGVGGRKGGGGMPRDWGTHAAAVGSTRGAGRAAGAGFGRAGGRAFGYDPKSTIGTALRLPKARERGGKVGGKQGKAHARAMGKRGQVPGAIQVARGGGGGAHPVSPCRVLEGVGGAGVATSKITTTK